MNRQEFLFKLQTELSFLPLDERENALKYYEEYFEDAGEENEAAIIAELGSPAQAAQKIRQSLEVSKNNHSSVIDDDNSGTDKKKSGVNIGKIELKLIESLDDDDNSVFNKDYGFNIDDGKSSEKTADTVSSNNKANNISATRVSEVDKNAGTVKAEESADKKAAEEEAADKNKNREDKSPKPNHDDNDYRKYAPKRSASTIILTVILLLFATPILIPVLASVFIVIISLFVAFFSVGVGFFCTSVAGIASAVGGIALVAYGLGMLFANIVLAIGVIGQGLLAIGAGLILAYIFFVLAKFTIKWSWKITCKIFCAIGGAIRNLFAPRYTYNAA